MHIEQIRVQNYRSIWDSGVLKFSPGFNVIVGPNNVGKTSLLHALTTRIQPEPHRSLLTLPTRDDVLPPTSRISIKISASSEEAKRLLLQAGNGRHFLPWPRAISTSQENCALAFDQIFNTPQLSFCGSFETARTGSSWTLDGYPATQGYKAVEAAGAHVMLTIDTEVSRLEIAPRSIEGRAPSEDFGVTAVNMLAQKIYRFSAERLALGTSSYGSSTELLHDARNLAEVLNILQGNPQRFEEYNALVSQIFPSVRKISVKPNAQNMAEILVWQLDPKSQRDDLATPLSQSGTGVGQVLALLYAAKNYDQPRTIIIDEPGSFLHPGASRSLIRILKDLSQHQYIIATHSPEVLSELSGAPVTRVKWEDAKTNFVQAPSTLGKVASDALVEIGARLSDVYGFDRILWTEGQSDADGISAILHSKGKMHVGLGIVPVRDTGSFRRRTIAEVLDIYSALTLRNSLLPPTLLFLFDRDGRPDKEIADAVRQSKGKVEFLERRMFENYLLNAEAIANVFNRYKPVHNCEASVENVSSYLEAKAEEARQNAGEPREKSSWVISIDGAGVLGQLFLEFSKVQFEFRKATHTPEITAEVVRLAPEAFDEITTLIAKHLEE